MIFKIVPKFKRTLLSTKIEKNGQNKESPTSKIYLMAIQTLLLMKYVTLTMLHVIYKVRMKISRPVELTRVDSRSAALLLHPLYTAPGSPKIYCYFSN